MSDERIKMPVLESSEPSGNPGSDEPKAGYPVEVPSNQGAKKEEKPAGDEKGAR